MRGKLGYSRASGTMGTRDWKAARILSFSIWNLCFPPHHPQSQCRSIFSTPYIPRLSWPSRKAAYGTGCHGTGACLKNPRDGGAWWAAICGVAQSWTRLSLPCYSVQGDSLCKNTGLGCHALLQGHIHTTLRWGRAPGKPSQIGRASCRERV